MILNSQPKQNVVASVINSQKLKISPDERDQAILVDLQISKLYKNKIRAVIQEYISNARDANTEAGLTETPIKIHLPEKDECFFSVSDSGFGMSPEVVEKYLCSTGASTKRETNSQIGSFGLGAKCGFSYIKEHGYQFNITTVSNGIKYFYVCYYDEMGYPTVSLISEEPTEDVGTAVTIPVHSFDVSKFFNEAQDILRFWFEKYPFEITSSHKLNYSLGELFYECDKYVIYKTHQYSGGVVSVGGIPYSWAKSNYAGFLTVVKINIGVLDIVPSREELELTKNNSSILDPIFHEATEYVKIHFQKVVDSCHSELEVYEQAFIRGKIPGSVISDLTFRGIEITRTKDNITTSKTCYNSFPQVEKEIKYIYAGKCKDFGDIQFGRCGRILGNYKFVVFEDYEELYGWRKNEKYYETWDEFSHNLREQILQKAILYSTLRTPRAKRDRSDESPTCWFLNRGQERFEPRFDDVSALSGSWFVGANMKPVNPDITNILTKDKADWSSSFVMGDIYMIPKRNVKLAEENENLKDIVSVAKEIVMTEESIKKIYSHYIINLFGKENAKFLKGQSEKINDKILVDFLNRGFFQTGYYSWEIGYVSGQQLAFYTKLFGKKYSTPDIEYVTEKYKLCGRFTSSNCDAMLELVNFIGGVK